MPNFFFRQHLASLSGGEDTIAIGVENLDGPAGKCLGVQKNFGGRLVVPNFLVHSKGPEVVGSPVKEQLGVAGTSIRAGIGAGVVGVNASARGVLSTLSGLAGAMSELVNLPLNTEFAPVLFGNLQGGKRPFEVLYPYIPTFSMVPIHRGKAFFDIRFRE